MTPAKKTLIIKDLRLFIVESYVTTFIAGSVIYIFCFKIYKIFSFMK
jgi:hypothetical protein